MISNSVTHLRRYTNSAIADIARNSKPISLETPDERSADVTAPINDVSASSDDIGSSNVECFVMFHNVLRVFHDVSQCFKCFMMFY